MPEYCIPTLNDYQHAMLVAAANTSKVVWIVQVPDEETSESDRNALLTHSVDMEELVGLGLAEEITEKMEDIIEGVAERIGKRVRVYIPTTNGFLMFNGSDKRPIN